jgi:UDP-N-acetyl-D-glucosamine dehydrogenase
MLMAHRMTVKIISALNRHSKSVRGSSILFVGVAYKSDIADERESPALKIMQEVSAKGGLVSYFDPYLPEVVTEDGVAYQSQTGLDNIGDYDCVVITAQHKIVDYDIVGERARLIVDLRNVFPHASEKIYKL